MYNLDLESVRSCSNVLDGNLRKSFFFRFKHNEILVMGAECFFFTNSFLALHIFFNKMIGKNKFKSKHLLDPREIHPNSSKNLLLLST